MSYVRGSADGPDGGRGRVADGSVPGVALRTRIRDAGAGETWSGRVERTGAECTVRRVRVPRDTFVREQALRSARALVDLRHPHVVQVLDVVPTTEGLAIISEPVPGAISLARLLERRDRLDPGEVVTVGLPLAQALAAIHAEGLTHGRVRADDVLLEPTGRPVLTGVGVMPLTNAPNSPAQDVGDLGAMLLGAMAQAVGPEAAAVAVAVAPALVDDLGRRPTAVDLADSLAHAGIPVPVRFVADPVTPLAPVTSLADVRAEAVGRARRGRGAHGGHTGPIIAAHSGSGGGSGGRGSGGRGSMRRPAGGPLRRWLARTDRSGFGSGSGHGWVPVVVSVVLLAILAAAGLMVALGTFGGSPARKTGPAAVTTPSARAAASAGAPAKPAPADWRGIVTTLDAARSRAFEQADAKALTSADAPGSPAYTADLALMRQVVARGARASGLRNEFIAVAVRQMDASRTVLRVTQRLLPYSFVDGSGKVLARQPGKPAAQRDVTLVRVAGVWRLSQTVEVT